MQNGIWKLVLNFLLAITDFFASPNGWNIRKSHNWRFWTAESIWIKTVGEKGCLPPTIDSVRKL